MASNITAFKTSSSPTCALKPQEPLLPFVTDNVLAIILPTIIYFIASGFFHILDVYNLFSNHRIHPSEDELKRNHVTRGECLKGVLRYHMMQISIGLLLNIGSTPPMTGDEVCRTHQLALTIQNIRSNILPLILNTIGINAKQLSLATQGTSTTLANILDHPLSSPTHPSPSSLFLANLTSNILIPLAQFTIALLVVDTWIYFTHRLCHVNKTLYRLVHAQHHRLYVSYAYGAVYAHWLETLFLDILSFVMAGELSGMSARQNMWFAGMATVKTISDHCGYVLPWDPTHWVNGNGARFHDLHHQGWGLKYNFSTYTVFWDNLLGTAYKNTDEAERKYRRVQEMTRKKALGAKVE
ncbi:MAG: hypothetical protein Q9170_007391 [Blastenia crenularia]